MSKKESSYEKPANEVIFDFEAVFDPDNYLYFYEHILTEERTSREVAFLVRELELDTPKTILDLACGHGRHANRLAEIGTCARFYVASKALFRFVYD